MFARINAFTTWFRRITSRRRQPAAAPGTALRTHTRTALVLGLAAIVLMAFRVSWNALSDVARAIGADSTAALLYPIVIDGLMALALISTLVLTGPDRKFALRVLAAYTLASLLLNYIHGLIPALHTEAARWSRLADWDPVNYALVLLATSLPVGSIYFGSDLVAKALHHNPKPTKPAKTVAATPGIHLPTQLKVAGTPEDVAEAAADAAEPSATSTADPEVDMGTIDPDLLALARRAPRGRGGKASRRHIEDTVRSTGRPIGKDEAERVKDALQAELDEAAAAEPSQLSKTAIAS